MKLNEIITINISDLAMGGEGVGKIGGLAVFVPDSIPGDELKVKLIEIKNNYSRGKMIEIIKPSPDRVAPKCPLAKECGGCQWQNISYPAQLKYKTKIVKDTLERLGKLKGIKVNDIIVSADGIKVRDSADFMSYLGESKSPGDTIKIALIRGTASMEVTVTIGQRPQA